MIDFLDRIPKVQANKEKKINWTSFKVKHCGMNNNIRKLKESTQWKKMLSNHTSDKELVSQLHKYHLQSNDNITNNPLKWVKCWTFLPRSYIND